MTDRHLRPQIIQRFPHHLMSCSKAAWWSKLVAMSA